MKEKNISINLIKTLIRESKKTNKAVQVKNTNLYLKYTQKTANFIRFVVYDIKPDIGAECHFVKLSIAKNPTTDAPSAIEGWDRLVDFAANRCKTALTFKKKDVKQVVRTTNTKAEAIRSRKPLAVFFTRVRSFFSRSVA